MSIRPPAGSFRRGYLMLRHRIPRRGRRAPPADIIRGHLIETRVSFQISCSGQVINRDYVTVVDGRIVSRIELGRDDVDRAAWEMHWRIRKDFRRTRQLPKSMYTIGDVGR